MTGISSFIILPSTFAPAWLWASLLSASAFFILPSAFAPVWLWSALPGFARSAASISTFYFLLSAFASQRPCPAFLHSAFCILHSPERVPHKPSEYNSPPALPSGWSGGTLVPPWTCPIPIEPPQTPVFDQPSLSRPLSRGISTAERFNLKNACEPTQRRKGAKTQGFRRVGTFTRWVSKLKPVFLSPSPCPLGLCLLASTLRSPVHPPQWCYGGRATEDGSLR